MERKKTAAALGLFDGVHLGHRAVLELACRESENGFMPGVFTFDPISVSRKTGGSQGYIYGSRQKMKLLCECGVRWYYSPSFDKLSGLSGEEFVRRVLKERLNVGFVSCGRDFRFGNNASCGTEELKEFGRKYSFRVSIAEDVRLDGAVVSSSSIRSLLGSGDITAANKLLGREYSIWAKVSDGNHIGRTLDFPTINQHYSSGQLVPRFGVYSTHTAVGGRIYRSITNVGIKPTIEGERSPLAETHILDFSGDLYGKMLEVSFDRFIRPERKFASLEELKTQIAKDIAGEKDI